MILSVSKMVLYEEFWIMRMKSISILEFSKVELNLQLSSLPVLQPPAMYLSLASLMLKRAVSRRSS